MERIELLEKLSAGYSMQSKTANQFWLVLIFASVISLTGKVNTENLIELPFTLGKVNPSDFYTISTILISILIIAYTSAMIQTIRTRMLIQIKIDSIADKFIGDIHIQDFLDSTLIPTYNRVGPISQFILGKNQFLGQGKQKRILRILGSILYVILKFSTYIFMYFIPVFSLNKCWKKLQIISENSSFHIYNWILISIVVLALISITILFLGDLKYLKRVVNHINKKPTPNKGS